MPIDRADPVQDLVVQVRRDVFGLVVREITADDKRSMISDHSGQQLPKSCIGVRSCSSHADRDKRHHGAKRRLEKWKYDLNRVLPHKRRSVGPDSGIGQQPTRITVDRRIAKRRVPRVMVIGAHRNPDPRVICTKDDDSVRNAPLGQPADPTGSNMPRVHVAGVGNNDAAGAVKQAKSVLRAFGPTIAQLPFAERFLKTVSVARVERPSDKRSSNI